MSGHACRPCTAAIEAEGALGASGLNRAVLGHLPDKKARRLRNLLDAGTTVTAWASQPAPRVPNPVPFDHLKRRVLSRL